MARRPGESSGSVGTGRPVAFGANNASATQDLVETCRAPGGMLVDFRRRWGRGRVAGCRTLARGRNHDRPIYRPA